VELKSFLSDRDAERARRTLVKLRRHGIAPLVLTGGLAIERHLMHGQGAQTRPLNDVDFLAQSFDDIPGSLASDFLIIHVHPHDPPGKTLLQLVDRETAVRIDIFRDYGNSLSRAIPIEIEGIVLRMVSVEDLTARFARLCMDLAFDMPVPAKHVRDLLRLLPLVKIDAMDQIWHEHRKPDHPQPFKETATLLAGLSAERKDLQIFTEYSRNAHEQCSRCKSVAIFPLADKGHVLSLIGYC
jgi:hypothetical protein